MTSYARQHRPHPSGLRLVVAPFLFLITTALVAYGMLTGCSSHEHPSSADQPAASERPVVLTTFTVIQDMAQQVAGDYLDVQSITKPGAEIHDYEPTPDDIARAAEVDLVLDNGLGLERWFDRFMADSNARRVDLSEGVEPMEIAEGEYQGNANPHAWMSPQNGQIYVDNIVSAFCELDPEHADEYQTNGEAYKAQIQEVADELEKGLADLPQDKRTLVTCEGAFSYLCRDAGLEEVYLWPVNAENEGTPQQVAAVIERVRVAGVATVFCESTVSPKAMQQVADEADVTLRTDADHVLYVDSLSQADGPVPSYLELLKHDVRVIVEGLTEEES